MSSLYHDIKQKQKGFRNLPRSMVDTMLLSFIPYCKIDQFLIPVQRACDGWATLLSSQYHEIVQAAYAAHTHSVTRH